MPVLTLGKQTIEFSDDGEGQTVVLLHTAS